MNTAQITKVTKSINESIELSKTDSFYNVSLGFRRFAALPKRVRDNAINACVLKGESSTDSIKTYLDTLTESEFITWLKII